MSSLLLVALGGLYLGFGRSDGGDGGAAVAFDEAPAVNVNALDRAALRAGELTLITGNGDNRPWYQLAMLDPKGRLRPFVRCQRNTYCGLAAGVDWSPDGKLLAFSVDAHRYLTPHIGVHVLDTTTGTDRRIDDHRLCFGSRLDLAWSPDGGRIAYVCSRRLRSRREIVIVAPGGAGRRLRTGSTAAVSSPTWSPDGGRLAYATKAAGAGPVVYTISVNGWGRTLVATNASAPDWSPDGTTIAYRAGCGGIKLATPSGLDVTPINGPLACRTIGLAGTPVWLPNGRQIAISNRSGVYLVNSDGSGLRRLTTHTGIGHHGGRPAWRPR